MSEVKNTKNKPNIFLIIIAVTLLIIVVGGGAFAGYYFANQGKSASAEPAKPKPVEEAYVTTEEFLLNLSDDDTRRFIKTKIVLAYDKKNKKLAKELEAKKAVFNDPIISVLRSKKASDMTGKGAEDLKKELLTRINAGLTNGKLTNIYYHGFLVQ